MKAKSSAANYNKLKNLEAREPDGHNNDGDNDPSNDQGIHDGAFSRATTNSYADGIGSLPAQATGLDGAGEGTLPSPRAVSNAVMAAGTSDIPNSFGVNEYFQFFGQLLAHDLAESSSGASGDPPVSLAGLPFPFGRTPFEDGTVETGPRQHTSDETSFLDLSMVYGNKQEVLDLLRADLPGDAGQSAKLLMGADNLLPQIVEVAADAGLTSVEVIAIWRPDGFGGLPDPATNPDPATFEDIYFAGDNRVNQTPLLISQHTVWAREHNYQVDRLTPTAVKHGWTEDQLFEAARAITEAEWQHVVYDEYLAKLIGEFALASYDGYKADVDPSILNEFTTVAFRFGHDQSSQTQQPLNEDGSAANPGGGFVLFTLAEAFAEGVVAARTSANIDEWLRGQLASQSQEIDGLVVDGNRNTLFAIGGGVVTVDLEVLDIMRARDHGVWNYNDLRQGLGLAAYASFDDYGADNGIDPTRLAALKAVYGDDIDKLDSIIGGLLEKKHEDSQLGETFTTIMIMQFEALRDGDRLYYLNRFADNPKLLAEIEGTTLADILARNTGIDHAYRDAFAAHDRISDTDGSIDGSGKNDLAIGSDGDDAIKTLGGNDDLYGGNGRDLLAGGTGRDFLTGGSGEDTFHFAEFDAIDRIHDFRKASDFIMLDPEVFTELGDGTLAKHEFVKGSEATTHGQRIVYDTGTGKLYYDADGSHAGAQVAFAKVDPHTALSHKNFTVEDLPI